MLYDAKAAKNSTQNFPLCTDNTFLFDINSTFCYTLSLLLWSKFSKTFVNIQQQGTFSNMRLIFMQSVLFQLTFI